MSAFAHNIKDPAMLEKLARLAGKSITEILDHPDESPIAYDIVEAAPPREVVEACEANPWPCGFLADQNMKYPQINYLQQAGVEVTQLTQRGLRETAKDEAIFHHARVHNMFLITCDRDFMDSNRFDYAHAPPGVIVLSPRMGRYQAPHDSPMLKAAYDHILGALPRSGWKAAHYTKTGWVNVFPDKPSKPTDCGTYPTPVQRYQYFL